MNVFDLYAKISLDTSGYEKGLNDASSKTSSFASKLKGGLATVGKIGVAAFGVASAATTAFAGSAVKAGMSFDASMSQVAATMGYTVEQLNDSTSEASQNFNKLRDFAQQMGSTTAFSASQAADALNYMALAGYDAETSMKMLPNVLNLAAAGGIELAEASDMVTDAQSALGLSLEETGYLVDVMAKTSSTTNTSVAQLGQALLTVGGTAKNLAWGSQEAAQVLGLLADNGIKGAEGGTALRNIILSLSAPTNSAAKAIKELGLQVFDSEGNMRDLESIFLELNDALKVMTQEQRSVALNEIFNKQDLKSVNALLGTTEQRWDDVWQATDHARNAASNMAGMQLDNLAGDVTLFKSALEGAQIVLSDKLTPTIRGFVQFGADGISRITEAFKSGGVEGAMVELGNIISDGATKLIDIFTKSFPTILNVGKNILSALVKGIINNLPQIIKAAVEIIMELVNGLMEELPALLDVAIELLMTIVDGLVENLPVLIPAVINTILFLVEKLTEPEMITQLINAAIQLIMALAQGLINAIPQLVQAIPTIIMNIVSALIQNAPQMLSAAWELIKMLAEGLWTYVKEVVSAIGKVFTRIKEGFTEKIEAAKDWGKDLIQKFVDGIKEKFQKLKDTISNVAQTVKDFLGFSEPEKGPLSDFHTYAPDMMKLFAEGIDDNDYLIDKQIEKSFDIEGKIGGAEAQTASASQPITIIVQSVLDGRIIGENVYDYINGRKRAYGV